MMCGLYNPHTHIRTKGGINMLEKMRSNIVRKYGFENKNTIRFFTACEDGEKERTVESLLHILKLYNLLMKN